MQTTHKISGDAAEGYAAYLTSTSSRGDYYTPDAEDEAEIGAPVGTRSRSLSDMVRTRRPRGHHDARRRRGTDSGAATATVHEGC